uniref:Valine--tRNA ligase n=1 Tax=candidate division WOR-3 bacterium TaxID=2052148 RepID=A0A7C4GF96_UNCW3
MSTAPPADFPSRYDPKPVEEKWYRFWQESGFFTPDPASTRPRFSIVIPPPNITGSLHVGHALNNTLQDIQIRFKKLQGFATLWLPGTDHASIGTHTHIDRALAAEGTNRFALGREEFLKRAWAWKEKYGARIIEQLKLLGCACDWTRTRFTMDEMLSRAVREAFCRYYEDGLIYRGTRIVNWCPRCHTAVSDLEVKHQDIHTHWWYIRYPRRDGSGFVVVATTRPETMLGDTAVAVNPADERYRNLIGQKLILPLTGREIPIIADELVLSDFGTGAVKVTPAHDAADFEMGLRHGLETITVIGLDARMTDKVPPPYQGLPREECRKRVVEDLTAQGLLEKTEPYKLSASLCERCGTMVEPLVSEQWFVRMAELAKPAIAAVESGRVKFIPERWTKVYLEWMNNIRDWCISRQLWWGHRIPVFYCDNCGEMMVERTDPTECRKCRSRNIRQDEDILDTWFSSALWPFSTLGWPDKTPDLTRFYPTDFLSTAPDIIFLWVARMIFSGLKFMGEVPFSRVYFHSFILVESGERMSRSKGVGIDPVDMFTKYGTDAVRFTLAYLESQSQSYRLSEKRFEFGRNFANKVWNAARLLAPHVAGPEPDPTRPKLEPFDEWIIAGYNRTVAAVTSGIENCTYSQAASRLYDFFWHDLCDWYLEFAKLRLKADDRTCRWTLRRVLRGTLQLLHPFMPFITEELWHRLGGGSSIMQSTWPAPLPLDREQVAEVETLRDIITAVRNIRAEMQVPAKARVECIVNVQNRQLAAFLESGTGLIAELAGVSALRFDSSRPPQSSVAVLSGCEVYIPLGDIVDVERELARIRREANTLAGLIAGIDEKFANPDFAARARAEVVENERRRRAELEDKLLRLRRQLESWTR